MPIYEYECKACKQRFERLQSFNDEPVRVCPHCGGETRRVLHPAGVVFKGSGWYSTDNRKSGSGSGSASSASTASEGSSSADSAKSPPTESKPASTGGDSD